MRFWRLDWGSFAQRLQNQTEESLEKLIRMRQGLLEPHQRIGLETGPACGARSRFLMQDDRLDVRIAYGYFDAAYGKSLKFSYWEADPLLFSDGQRFGKMLYGESIAPSLDGEEFWALRNILVKRCPHNQPTRALCGFQILIGGPEQRRIVLKKDIFVNQKQIPVYVTVTLSSISPFYEKNMGEWRQLQNQVSWQSEQNFLKGLRSADFVFYVGHSRITGGPDFWPPVLRNSDLKVDYHYYHQVQKGRRLMMKWLQSPPKRHGVLGLFSCESDIFTKDILGVRPNLSVIATQKLIRSSDTTVALAVYLDALFRGECVSEVTRFLNKEIFKDDFFKAINFQ